MDNKEIYDANTEMKKQKADKLLSAAMLAQFYTDNKKILKHIRAIIKTEQKSFEKSNFTLTKEESNELLVFLDDSIKIITQLIKADSVYAYNRAKSGIGELIDSLEKYIKRLTVKASVDNVVGDVKSAFSSAKDKIKSFAEKVKAKVTDTDKDEVEG